MVPPVTLAGIVSENFQVQQLIPSSLITLLILCWVQGLQSPQSRALWQLRLLALPSQQLLRAGPPQRLSRGRFFHLSVLMTAGSCELPIFFLQSIVTRCCAKNVLVPRNWFCCNSGVLAWHKLLRNRSSLQRVFPDICPCYSVGRDLVHMQHMSLDVSHPRNILQQRSIWNLCSSKKKTDCKVRANCTFIEEYHCRQTFNSHLACLPGPKFNVMTIISG